ncbi:MAG: site-specific integrase [Bacteroidales bacterium]|nr:site-specific integrase [Bacteroidales bacterium]
MIGVTTAIIHDKRVSRKDGTYAIKLRVTFKRIQKYYPVNVSLTEDEWDKVYSERPRKEYKDNLTYFNKVEHDAIEIIKSMPVFSFSSFEKKFNQGTKTEQDALMVFKVYIDQLKEEGRVRTASSYSCAMVSIKSFVESKHRKRLNFWDITPGLLTEYESWMLKKGNSNTTVGIYLRSLRTIVNLGIEQNLMDKDSYPFGKRKYQIPAGKNTKKALVLDDIKNILEYQTKTDAETKARDLWIFSYLCNGVNVKDIAKLKYKNLSKTHISFTRAKTARSTKTNQKQITIIRMPEIDAIIEKWGIESDDPNAYVFGLISENDTPEKELANIKQAVKNINKYMKRIGEALELNLKLTTYTARHSYATILKRSGAPIEFISESLGHKDLKTTENYLDSFEDDVKESYQRQLLNFKTK